MGHTSATVALGRRCDDALREASQWLKGVPLARGTPAGAQYHLPLWAGGGGVISLELLAACSALGDWGDAMPAVLEFADLRLLV